MAWMQASFFQSSSMSHSRSSVQLRSSNTQVALVRRAKLIISDSSASTAFVVVFILTISCVSWRISWRQCRDDPFVRALHAFNLGNLAGTETVKLDELRRELDTWRMNVGAEMMKPNQDYDPSMKPAKKKRQKTEVE